MLRALVPEKLLASGGSHDIGDVSNAIFFLGSDNRGISSSHPFRAENSKSLIG
jgi:hypothetical protein